MIFTLKIQQRNTLLPKGVKPRIPQSELRIYTKVVPFKESFFHFVVLWKLPIFDDLVVFQYLYGGFDAWSINTEFLGGWPSYF